jgi:glyoxylase-like metal-dependent hydrolase (beta-lactamase superfamily II)
MQAGANGTIAVHAIRTGDVWIKSRQLEPRHERRPARVLDVLRDREWAPRLPISCYLIEHPDGAIVVDTGESSHVNDPGYLPWWHPVMRSLSRFAVAPEEEIGPQLRALGHSPRSISKVVMTHMHDDHAGGLSHFPGVEVLMTEREAAMALSRSGRVNGYLNEHYPEWLSPTRITFDGDAWETFDASIALTADGAVRLIPTPGHTLGHLSVVIDRGEHLVLLAGDSTYTEQALLSGAIDGVAQDEKRHRDSTARIRELCARRRVVIVPTHDPGGAKRLADAQVTSAAPA